MGTKTTGNRAALKGMSVNQLPAELRDVVLEPKHYSTGSVGLFAQGVATVQGYAAKTNLQVFISKSKEATPPAQKQMLAELQAAHAKQPFTLLGLLGSEARFEHGTSQKTGTEYLRCAVPLLVLGRKATTNMFVNFVGSAEWAGKPSKQAMEPSAPTAQTQQPEAPPAPQAPAPSAPAAIGDDLAAVLAFKAAVEGMLGRAVTPAELTAAWGTANPAKAAAMPPAPKEVPAPVAPTKEPRTVDGQEVMATVSAPGRKQKTSLDLAADLDREQNAPVDDREDDREEWEREEALPQAHQDFLKRQRAERKAARMNGTDVRVKGGGKAPNPMK